MKTDTYTKILLTVTVLFLGVIALGSLPKDIQEEIWDRGLPGDRTIIPIGNPSNREFLEKYYYAFRLCRWDVGPPDRLECSDWEDVDNK